MTGRKDVVWLLDVDNTLLENDRVVADLDEYLQQQLGRDQRDRYWTIFESLRAELGYADYLGACQRWRLDGMNDPRLPRVALFLLDYPFADRLYPGSLDLIRHLGAWGSTVILSDGDVVLQPLKIRRSGLSDAVDGRVLIYLHKEAMLEDVERRYPARHYVAVDDKLRLLAAMKSILRDRLTTVFPRQGHYAFDPAQVVPDWQPDVTVERIGDLIDVDLAALLDAPAVGRAASERR